MAGREGLRSMAGSRARAMGVGAAVVVRFRNTNSDCRRKTITTKQALGTINKNNQTTEQQKEQKNRLIE